MARMLKGMLEELSFGNIGVEIPTYVRNDNSTVACQVDSFNTVSIEIRLDGFLGINRVELEKNNCLTFGYIPGDMNASEGLTKAMSSANSRCLLTENSLRIVTEV